MTSKEKALELTNKFYDDYGDMDWDRAKECAIICVDEILINIEATKLYYDNEPLELNEQYWREVKEYTKDL